MIATYRFNLPEERSILPWRVSRVFYLGSGYIAESEVGHESRTTTARDISRGIWQYGAPALLAKRRYLTWPKALLLPPTLALLY